MTRPPFLLALLAALTLAAFAPLALAQPPAPAPAPALAPAPAPAPAPAASSSPAARSFTDTIPCSACHSTTAWRAKDATGTEATKFDHSTTGFPLTGQHIHASCVACHNSTRAIKRACVSCHDDFHRGRLSESCDNCHSPAGWRVTRPLEIHRMTRFPLTGMHVLADCTECHVRASEHRWSGAPTDCYSCHFKEYALPTNQPPHVGTATTAPFPRDCSICHRAVAWVPAVLNKSLAAAIAPGSLSSGSLALSQKAPPTHDLRFPLSFGVHRLAACDDCHSSQAVPRAVRCIGCHAHDPTTLMQQHRQTVATDGAACIACHPGGARR